MMEERTMKKYIISLAFVLAAGISVFGQTSYLSEIKIVNREVVKTGDRQANVKMTVSLDDLDIKNQHSVRVVPVILSADGTQQQELPSFVINGKVRDKVQQRTEAFEDTNFNPDAVVKVRRKNGTAQTLDYDASVPFKRWMIGGDLRLRAYVTGCALCDEGDENTSTGDVFPPMNPAYYSPFIQPKEEIVKRRSETRSARLQFRQDSHRIDPKFKNNEAELDTVRNSISLVKDNNDLTITGIYVTGYASPEGTFAYNMKLSERRAKAFTEYMKDDLEDVDPKLYHVDWKGEDWGGLREEVVKHPGLLKIDEVLNIIDNCGDDKDACEEQLKALVPPEIYQRLLNEMYPAVRRNEYRIEYNVRHFDLAEGKQMIKTRPDLMSVSEIQQVADSYGKGSPEYVDCLVRGAKAYPNDVTAVNNAALALMEANRTGEAIRLLENAPAEGELLNMKGAAYAKAGQYDKAARAFSAAQAKGYSPAGENLSLLKQYVEYMAE